MIDWFPALADDLRSAFGDAPKIATLATVGIDGTPQARCVVVRKFDGDGSLAFTTDRRSQKMAELAESPRATLVFWLPDMRKQYRLVGAATVLAPDDPRVAEQWRAGSDGSRAMFHWPAPGEPLADGPFAKATSADAPVPATFAVLSFRPTTVERLDLTQVPHDRRRWTKHADRWTCERLNP